MSKRKATSTPKHAKETLATEQMRVKHTEMLNASFYRWIQEQHANHRSELWRNGLEEYLQYGRSIQDRYPLPIDSKPQSIAHAEEAFEPRAKQAKLIDAPSQQAASSSALGVVPTSTAAASHTSSKPAAFSFGNTTAASSEHAAGPSDSMQPPALPPFKPVYDWGSPSSISPGIFSSAQSLSQPSTRDAAVPSTLHADTIWKGPTPMPPLPIFSPPPSTSDAGTALASAPGLVSSRSNSATGTHPTPSDLKQSADQSMFGSTQPQLSFPNSIFPASTSFAGPSSNSGSPTPAISSWPDPSGASQAPAFGSPQAFSSPPLPAFSSGASQPAAGTSSTSMPALGSSSMPAFSLGASQPAAGTSIGSIPSLGLNPLQPAATTSSSSTPAFSFGASQPAAGTSSASMPVFSFGGAATPPPTFGSGASPPAFGASPPAFGATPPFAFGASQPAANTSTPVANQPAGNFGTSTAAFSWAPPPSLSNGSSAAPFGNNAPSADAPSTSAPFSFTRNPPAAQSNAAPASGAATFGGFSFTTSASTSFGSGNGFGGQNGFATPASSAQQDGAQQEEEQAEPEAPTEYVKDEGVVVSQDIKWRHQKPDKTGWEKTRKGRVLARKSEKGALYLQFVTDSGQVVSTANIVGNLTPAKNPTTLVSVLSVSTRQPSKDGADSFGDPVTMMTMLTCNSEAATQDLLQKLKGEKAGK